MNCAKCGSEDHRVVSFKTSTRMNEFGRKELRITVETEDFVRFDPKTKLYNCLKCGGSFTIQEAVSQ